MIVNWETEISGKEISACMKIEINGEVYAIIGITDELIDYEEFLAVKLGDAIENGKAPLYYIWNSVRDNSNHWDIDGTTDGTNKAWVEVE